MSYVKWRPRDDWLYRQYLVGVGESAADAENAVGQVLGAAAGWVDRPHAEEELAELLVQFSLRKSSQLAPAAHEQAWSVLPARLHNAGRDDVEQALRLCADPAEVAIRAMITIHKHELAGGEPIQGTSKNGGEGWHNNPAYAAVDVPVALRFFDHFKLYDMARHPPEVYRQAVVLWADYSLDALGGTPLDWNKLRAAYRTLWPNRLVMLVRLLLRAHRETNDDKYASAAGLLFDEVLMNQVKQNPHGYFWAWGQSPQKAEVFDLNYNVAAYDRGIIDFWSEQQLDVIGRKQAADFAAARYFAFSGQLLDTLETDSMTAVASQYAGHVPFAVGQAALLLYDDFPFYRGLVGEQIRWSVIDDGGTLERRDGRGNLYTMKIGSRGLVYWAYDIGRDGRPSSKTARVLGRSRGVAIASPTSPQSNSPPPDRSSQR